MAVENTLGANGHLRAHNRAVTPENCKSARRHLPTAYSNEISIISPYLYISYKSINMYWEKSIYLRSLKARQLQLEFFVGILWLDFRSVPVDLLSPHISHIDFYAYFFIFTQIKSVYLLDFIVV